MERSHFQNMDFESAFFQLSYGVHVFFWIQDQQRLSGNGLRIAFVSQLYLPHPVVPDRGFRPLPLPGTHGTSKKPVSGDRVLFTEAPRRRDHQQFLSTTLEIVMEEL
jgi:hypothetical protein